VKPYEPVTEVLYQNIVISNMELERMKPLAIAVGLLSFFLGKNIGKLPCFSSALSKKKRGKDDQRCDV
jgi:hypothetical protein